MSSIVPMPVCLTCKHFHGGSAFPVTCEAYPKGIPEAIWAGGFDHRQPYSGDNGVQYEAKPADAS